jgi:hypothetical protein
MPDRLDAQLRDLANALVDEAPVVPPFPEGHQPPRDGRRKRHPVATTVAAAVALIIVGTVIVLAADDNKSDVAVRAPSPTPTAAPVPPVVTPPGICGAALPVRVVAPPDFVGPKPGPGPDATVDAAADQFVEHWTRIDGGSVEVRWPHDADGILAVPSAEPQRGGASVVSVGPPDANGRYVRHIYFNGPPHQLRQCQVVQVDVRDADPARADTTVEYILGNAYDVDRRLVTNSATADAAPAAITCPVPAGTPASPNRGGTVTTPSYPTPTDALNAFVTADPTLFQFGYTELSLPDGSIAYGAPKPTPDGFAHDVFVTVIHVSRNEGGWAVDWWDGSGC